MKPLVNPESLTASSLFKITAFVLLSFGFFFLGKHWNDGLQPFVYFSPQSVVSSSSPSSAVIISPNANLTYDIDAIISDNSSSSPPPPPPPPPESPPPPPLELPAPPPPPPELPPPPPPPLPSPPPPPADFGVVDENGMMSDDFSVGEFNPDLIENWGNETETETVEEEGGDGTVTGEFRVKKFPLCPESLREWIPCLDNEEAIKKLPSTAKGERWERHCPKDGEMKKCLVPPPKGYKVPIPWPRSRDEEFNNVLNFKDNAADNRTFESRGDEEFTMLQIVAGDRYWLSMKSQKFH